MNFNPVGRDENDDRFMKFHAPLTIVEKIQLLQRSILVNSFAYYELDSNILTDFQYDNNAKQLAEFKKLYPVEFGRSRYYEYFRDYCSDVDGTVNTSGFDLLRKIEKNDKELYRHIWIDAALALDLKSKRGVSV